MSIYFDQYWYKLFHSYSTFIRHPDAIELFTVFLQLNSTRSRIKTKNVEKTKIDQEELTNVTSSDTINETSMEHIYYHEPVSLPTALQNIYEYHHI